MDNVAFDYTNLVDSTGGIGDEELRSLRPRLEEAVSTVLQDRQGSCAFLESGGYCLPG